MSNQTKFCYMKKIALIIAILFTCKYATAETSNDASRESSFYSSLFSSLYYLDNSDFPNSLDYWQKAFDSATVIDEKKPKAYAHILRALWFQKRFPDANGIIGRQTNLSEAIEAMNLLDKKTDADNKLILILTSIRDNTFYVLPEGIFKDIYNALREYPPTPASEFVLHYLKFFLKEEKYLKYVDDYIYFLKGDYLARARLHANIALCVLNSRQPNYYHAFSPELHLKKAIFYYNKFDAATKDSSISNSRSEIGALSKKLASLGTDYYTANSRAGTFKYVSTNYVVSSGKDEEEHKSRSTEWAAIEIGADGVKLSIINVALVNVQGEYEFTFLKTGTYRSNFQKLSAVNINQTFEAVKSFYDTIVQGYNIPDNQIFIAFSSGAVNKTVDQKRPKVIDSLKRRFYDSHVFRDNENIAILTLDVRDEARLTLLGIVPGDVRGIIYTAGILDVGTGNVKGGFCKDDNCSAMNFPYIESSWGLGKILASLPNNPDLSTLENARQYADAADILVKNIMNDDIGSQLSEAALRDKQQIFTTGGIFWAIATIMHPKDVVLNKKNFVQITESDVRAFRKIAIENYPTNPAGDNAEVNKAIREVTSTILQDKAIAGSTLVLGIFAEFNKSKLRPKKYYYSKYSVVGWPSGLIIREQSE